jgi:hypothetical protein
MKKSIATLVLLAGMAGATFADEPARAGTDSAGTHRYVVERTFPPGALSGLDRAAKDHVNANNARFGVRWVTSFANADQTRTFCIYEGPSEAAIRDAAEANGIPVDAVTEVPVTLTP